MKTDIESTTTVDEKDTIEQCTFCTKKAVRGGSENKFCIYHWGYMKGAMKASEQWSGNWRDAEKHALDLLKEYTNGEEIREELAEALN